MSVDPLYTLAMISWRTWATSHIRLLAYGGGSLLIATWTILRFLTQRTIFDLVGQQVLTQQLLHGGISGAGIGITNYIPKMFILYAPMVLLPGSPRLKLAILTVIVNVATLVLLGLVLEKVLRAFGVKVGGALYIALLWLAAIAGSVFWIQFTNSRNLEVVGGLFLLYIGIRYLEHPSWKGLVVIFLFSPVLFFADTLQVYMTAAPLVLYGASIYRDRWRQVAWLTGALLASYAVARLIFVLAAHILSIHFVQDTSKVALPSLHTLLSGTVGAVAGAARLYSGGVDAGNIRRACNGLFLCLLVATVIYGAWRKLFPRRLVLLVTYILVINMAVYILSGQAAHTDTERYLIMTAPAVLLLLGASQKTWQRFRTPGSVIVCLFLLVNVVFLGRAVAQGARLHFSQDAHLASVERFVAQHPRVLPYSSMDTAIPGSYLSGSDSKMPLPLGCTSTGLVKDSLFYSQSAFQKREAKNTYTSAAVILDGTAISNVPSVCSEAQIITQLGQPSATTTTDDGSIVLLYGKAISGSLPSGQ
jgi:hypothetical protein